MGGGQSGDIWPRLPYCTTTRCFAPKGLCTIKTTVLRGFQSQTDKPKWASRMATEVTAIVMHRKEFWDKPHTTLPAGFPTQKSGDTSTNPVLSAPNYSSGAKRPHIAVLQLTHHMQFHESL